MADIVAPAGTSMLVPGTGGSAMGLGGLAVGGIGGLILGSLMSNNGGIFGGNRSNGAEGALLALEGVEAINDVSRDVLQSSAALGIAQASANFNTLQSINGLGMLLNTNQHNSDLEVSQNFAAQTAVIQQNFTNSLIQSSRDQAAIQASFAANAAANAACCCEIKSAIAADGQATRALITQNLINQLQTDLSNSRQNEALRNVADAQTRVILGHLMPSTPVVRTV